MRDDDRGLAARDRSVELLAKGGYGRDVGEAAQVEQARESLQQAVMEQRTAEAAE